MSAIEPHDASGGHQRLRPMTDQKHRSPRTTLRQRGADVVLERRVQRVHRLVKDEKLRIAQHCAREPQPLTLAAREPQAFLANPVFKAIRQRCDQLAEPRDFDCVRKLAVARLRPRAESH